MAERTDSYIFSVAKLDADGEVLKRAEIPIARLLLPSFELVYDFNIDKALIVWSEFLNIITGISIDWSTLASESFTINDNNSWKSQPRVVLGDDAGDQLLVTWLTTGGGEETLTGCFLTSSAGNELPFDPFAVGQDYEIGDTFSIHSSHEQGSPGFQSHHLTYNRSLDEYLVVYAMTHQDYVYNGKRLSGIYAARIDGNGLIENGIQIHQDVIIFDHTDPVAACGEDGGYVVAWRTEWLGVENPGGENTTDIKGRRLDSGAAPSGTLLSLSGTVPARSNSAPRIAAGTWQGLNQDYLVAWTAEYENGAFGSRGCVVTPGDSSDPFEIVAAGIEPGRVRSIHDLAGSPWGWLAVYTFQHDYQDDPFESVRCRTIGRP